jgi:peroxiredoxin
MKKSASFITAAALVVCGIICSFKIHSGDHPTLPIGATAPDFSLPGVDGKTYTLNSFKNSPVLAIVFTCNHCPTAQAYEDRIIQLSNDYRDKGVTVIAIMPNDPRAIRLDELGYTDLSDSFDEMKLRAAKKHYNFPYLYDGATQTTAIAYGPIATPHVFIFDKDRKLCYSGRIDDVEKPGKTPHTLDTRNALDAILANKKPDVATTKVFGCSIKWAEKEEWQPKAKLEWAKEPVKLDTMGVAGIKELMQNKTDKLRLITVWSATNPASATAMPQFVEMNRMYRHRDFEWVTISVASNTDAALQFLQHAQASATNLIFNGADAKALNNTFGIKRGGTLPYTLLVEPNGKIAYLKQGPINPAAVKTMIVDNPLIGRYY